MLATKLGDNGLLQHVDTLLKRAARAYSSLFDRGVGLMVPKLNGGQRSPGFIPIEWGKGYTEGNAWHHSFPPYAITPAALAPGSSFFLSFFFCLLLATKSFIFHINNLFYLFYTTQFLSIIYYYMVA